MKTEIVKICRSACADDNKNSPESSAKGRGRLAKRFSFAESHERLVKILPNKFFAGDRSGRLFSLPRQCLRLGGRGCFRVRFPQRKRGLAVASGEIDVEDIDRGVIRKSTTTKKLLRTDTGKKRIAKK